MDLKKLPKLPVLLTKAEALDHAAQALEQMGEHISLMSTIIDMWKGEPAFATNHTLKYIQDHLPDARLQIRATEDAAAAIRTIALEERVVAARMAADREAKA